MKSGDQQKDENVNKKTTKMAIGNNNELKKKRNASNTKGYQCQSLVGYRVF